MSTAPVSSNSIYNELQSFFHQRRSDIKQLGKDLQSGDLTAAQNHYQDLQTLGQSGPFADGSPYGAASREQDFENIGAALQSGNLDGAKQALLALASYLRSNEREQQSGDIFHARSIYSTHQCR